MGNFDLSDQRLRFDRNAFAARALLFDPRFNQFLSGSDGSFDTLAVSGQVESRNVGVIVTLKFRFVYRLKKHGVAHDDPSSREFYNSLAH